MNEVSIALWLKRPHRPLRKTLLCPIVWWQVLSYSSNNAIFIIVCNWLGKVGSLNRKYISKLAWSGAGHTKTLLFATKMTFCCFRQRAKCFTVIDVPNWLKKLCGRDCLPIISTLYQLASFIQLLQNLSFSLLSSTLGLLKLEKHLLHLFDIFLCLRRFWSEQRMFFPWKCCVASFCFIFHLIWRHLAFDDLLITCY